MNTLRKLQAGAPSRCSGCTCSDCWVWCAGVAAVLIVAAAAGCLLFPHSRPGAPLLRRDQLRLRPVRGDKSRPHAHVESGVQPHFPCRLRGVLGQEMHRARHARGGVLQWRPARVEREHHSINQEVAFPFDRKHSCQLQNDCMDATILEQTIYAASTWWLI